MEVIDLFSGVGGFSHGFKESGFTISKAVEFNNTIAESYTINHPNTNMIVDDISNIDNDNFFSENESDIIIGGPPCQGFSAAGARNRKGFIDDERNYLFRHYFNIVKLIKPKIFLMENVKGILTMQKGKVFEEILNIFNSKELLDGDKYYLYPKLVNAKDFGIPQNRERVIILGVLNQKIDFNALYQNAKKEIVKLDPSFFDPVTVWDAIGNLPSPSKDGIVNNVKPKTNYQNSLSSNKEFIYNHLPTNHSKQSIERMEKVKQNENFEVLNENINSVFSGSYGRLSRDGISPTITTRFDTPSGGRFIHPFENRTITPREAARLQSFPDDFVFNGSKSSITTQIGNAVPPKISKFYATLSKEIINEHFITKQV